MEATALNKFRTFDQWLLAKIKQGQNISFPITDKKCFKKSIISFQKEYFKEHGSTERVRNFINKYFYTKDKQRLAKAFVIKGETIAINKVINMLYNERSAFVHMARFPQISENGKKMIGCFNINGKDIIVNINISINTIQEMFEKAFIKFIRARCV